MDFRFCLLSAMAAARIHTQSIAGTLVHPTLQRRGVVPLDCAPCSRWPAVVSLLPSVALGDAAEHLLLLFRVQHLSIPFSASLEHTESRL